MRKMCPYRSWLCSLPVLAHQCETVAPCDEARPCAKISRSFWCLWRVLLTSTSDRGELSRPSGPEWAEGSRCHTHTLMTCRSILAGVLGQDFSTKPNRRMNHVRPSALIFRSFETWRQKQARTTQQGGNPWLLRLRFFETVLADEMTPSSFLLYTFARTHLPVLLRVIVWDEEKVKFKMT